MEWISVEDRIPPDLDEVMFTFIMYGNKFTGQDNDIIQRDIVCGHLDHGIWHVCYLFISIPLSDNIKVTHWMPLPELPK